MDGINYISSGNSLIFIVPYQYFSLLYQSNFRLLQIAFNRDYYCIELHKHDVACNGVLFNTVYQLPHVEVVNDIYVELTSICLKIRRQIDQSTLFTNSIIKSYLQLLLSIASDEKQKLIDRNLFYTQLKNEEGIVFQDLVEKF